MNQHTRNVMTVARLQVALRRIADMQQNVQSPIRLVSPITARERLLAQLRSAS